MEPDVQHPIEEREAEQGLATADDRGSESIAPAPLEMGDGIQWVLIGPRGLRWGWSVALFLSVTFLAAGVIGAIAKYFVGAVHAQAGSFSALRLAVSEAVMVLALAVAGVVVAVVERRRLKDFNLGGPRGASHFFAGLRAGFAALSALVGLLCWAVGSTSAAWRSLARPLRLTRRCGASAFFWWAQWRKASSAAICKRR